MAAPNYSTDLITLAEAADTDTGSWTEYATPYHSGGAPSEETDYFIQGTTCMSQSFGVKVGLVFSSLYDYGSDLSSSFVSGGDNNTCVFMWQVVQAGTGMDTYANGGLRMTIASDDGSVSQNDGDVWITGGSDFGRNPYGGFQNVVVDPTHPVDYTIGAGNGGAYRYFGSMPNTIAQISKGSPHGVDAIRYGRGSMIVSGGDAGNGYGTFVGMATENDDVDNKWGLFQEQPGTYLWKGQMSFGLSSQVVDFRDSNRSIVIDLTLKTYPTFNRIEIHNASSRVDWTGINISAQAPSGYYAPGDFEVVDNATVNLDTCVFTDMGEFIFQSNSTINDTTFRRCEQVNWGNGLFDGCTFETTRASAAIYTEDLTDIDNCAFDGGDEGGNAIHMSAAGSYTFIGNTFTGYGASASPSAAIYHDSEGHLIINVQDGDSPTVYNIGGSTAEVNNPVILTLSGLVSGSEVRFYEAGTQTELDGVENSGTSFDYPYNFEAGTYVDIVVHHVDYVYYRIETFLLPSTSGTIPVQQQFDRWYSNP